MKKLTLLFPMLLMAVFIGRAQENIALIADTLSTSHVSPWEVLEAINDGFDPASSTDNSNRAYGNWVGSEIGKENWDWIQYSWKSLYVINKSQIYWWTDGGGIQIPEESYIQYRDVLTGNWVEVPNHSGFTNDRDKYNEVTFDPVLTNGIRYHMLSTTQATGVIEWKVFGELGEQDLYNSTIVTSPDLAPGVTSNLKVTAIKVDGTFQEDYVFKAVVDITNVLSGTGWNDEVFNVAGQDMTAGTTEITLPATNANGESTIDVLLPASIDPTDGIQITVKYNDGVVTLGKVAYYAPARTSPALTADNTSNTVDHPLEITFTDNAIWRSDITDVLVDGIALTEGTDYELQAGMLTLKPENNNPSLISSGTKSVLVKATGFENTSVTQEIKSGAASSNKTTVKALIGLYKGVTTSIIVTARDRFGNPLKGYALKYDIEVVNDDPTVTETYVVQSTDITSSVFNLNVPVTDDNGKSSIDISIPSEVDFKDGLRIVVKLEDNTVINELEYIDASLTTSFISGKKVGEIAIAGRLYTEIHSLFEVALNENNKAIHWYNLGYSGGGIKNTETGGNFGNFGLDVPWNERDQTYPTLDSIFGLPVVSFNGSNYMKSNYPGETDITEANSVSIELWVYDTNPQAGEVIMGWESRDGSAGSAPIAWPEGITGNDSWRHLVVVCGADNTEKWYLDGVEIKSGARTLSINPEHIMVLGGATHLSPSFEGSILTVRVHKDVLTTDQIAHNFNGGGMLGTTLRFNLDPNVKKHEGYHYDTWSLADPEDYFYGESEHFDHRVKLDRITSMNEADRTSFYNRIPGMFALAEACYQTYSKVHALRTPIVSAIADYRGDGIKYRIKIGTTDGANYMGWHGALGFGYAMQFPGFINPHEFVHGVQAQTGGMWQGNYWEAHANWPQTYMGIYQSVPSFIELRDNALFEATGRSYYDAHLMMQHLAETPEYGPAFISKLWYDGSVKDIYPWVAFKELDPDPSTTLGYEWARMVQKNVTWDYIIHKSWNPLDSYNPNLYRDNVRNNWEQILSQGYIIPESIIDEPGWLRAPKGKIPQQTGWNLIPLTVGEAAVTVSLSGYIDPERGSAWYGGFVAVNEEGEPRYSDIISNGETLNFNLNSGDQELYFAIVAIPDNVMAIDMVSDVRKAPQDPFPYKIKFEGTQPLDKISAHFKEKVKNISGAPHVNGGGFVDDKATVSETAYVGPNAYVIGTSKVLDNARVEDHAVVQNATVSGNAIVSGYSVTEGGAKVTDYARLRDFARIFEKSTLSEYAKISEHAFLINGKVNSGHVTLKGAAVRYGNATSGTAMMDHHFAKGQTLTKGKWFSWSWGEGKNPGEFDKDFKGLYMQMSFEKEHPFMAWDDFGITWGYLRNGASTVAEAGQGKALSLDGNNQFVELQSDVSDQIDISVLFDAKWEGGTDNQPAFYFGNAAGNYLYFTPSDANGKAALIMKNNGAIETIAAEKALTQSDWTKVEVYSTLDGTKLYIGEELIGENPNIRIQNLTVGAERFHNFLGRNLEGDAYFKGMLDNFEVYNVNLKDATSVNDKVDLSANIKIYPNPSNERVTVEVDSNDPAYIQIIDLKGARVFNSEFSKQIELNKSNFGKAGLYTVIISSNGEILHKGKVMIH